MQTWKTALAGHISHALSPLGIQMAAENVYKLLTTPPKFELGQAALPCFPFAKQLKITPPAAAQMLSGSLLRIEELISGTFPLRLIEISGGYINFHLSFWKLANQVLPSVSKTFLHTQSHQLDQNATGIVVEFSQPNTHKALHVGHLRCLVLGDVTSRLLSAVGNKVVRATYPGDLGTHIAKTLWFLNEHILKKGIQLPTNSALQADWLGEQYAKADDAFKLAISVPESEEAKETKLKITEILKELHSGKGKNYELWQETREWSFAAMRRVYDWLKTPFDIWFTESECDAPSAELVKNLHAQGKFVLDNGAIGINLEEFKLGFALFLKSDGNGLYITKDLELLKRKFALPGVTKSIVVVDARQKLHFQQLFKSAELVGLMQPQHSSFHLSYETVNTKDGKAFSSRSLTGMKLFELKERMELQVETEFLSRYKNDWSEQEIKTTASQIAAGALRYGFLRVDNNTQVFFDLDEWLKLEGDTGPYLQYVCARIKSLLRKQNANNPISTNATLTFDSACLAEIQEQELLVHLTRFSDALKTSAQEYRPAVLASYLFDLAKSFNRFYENCSLQGATGSILNSRIMLAKSTQETLEFGLNLLGIEAPERM